MKANKKDLENLSAYLDGELSPSGRSELEGKLETSLELKKELESLRSIKSLTSSIKKLPEAPYFETKLMVELESKNSPKRKLKTWVPAIGLAVVTIAIMVVLKMNPTLLTQIWEDQKTNIAGFYKENLQSLLFTANLTNEDLFDFAFNNKLPLDNSRRQYLQIGYDESGKEFFEIKTASLSEDKKSSYQEFVNVLQLSRNEQKLVDSIISSYAEEMQSQVLINENNTVAINQNLWNYRTALLADLLILAEDLNKSELDKFIPGGLSRDDRVRVVNAVNKIKSVPENRYIFLTPDSIFSEAFAYVQKKPKRNIDGIKEQLKGEKEKGKLVAVALRYDSTWQSAMADGNDKTWQKNFRIKVDPYVCRVDLEDVEIPEIQIPDFDSIQAMVDEATTNFQFYSYKVPKIEHSNQGIKIKYFQGDSIQTYEFNFEEMTPDVPEFPRGDMVRDYDLDRLNDLNDSVLSRFQFNYDEFQNFDSEELKAQMEELQKELQNFREEMRQWQIEIKQQQTTKYRK